MYIYIYIHIYICIFIYIYIYIYIYIIYILYIYIYIYIKETFQNKHCLDSETFSIPLFGYFLVANLSSLKVMPFAIYTLVFFSKQPGYISN